MDKNIATFLREDTKTVGVRFIQDNFDKSDKGYRPMTIMGDDMYRLSEKVYTYVTDLDLKEKDLVLVFAQGVPKIVVVDRVDDEISIQPNDDVEYKWIVCKIDLTQYNENLMKNAEIVRTVGQSYKKNVRRQFQAMMTEGLEEADRIKLLSIVGKKNA